MYLALILAKSWHVRVKIMCSLLRQGYLKMYTFSDHVLDRRGVMLSVLDLY